MDRIDQLTAFTMAHRVVLAYLVKVVSQLPSEQAAADPTVTMLRNSLPPLFANFDSAHGQLLAEVAGQEVDRIFIALFRPVPKAP